MVNRKTNAETIVKAALELFRYKGYRATSMADVGRACGLLKGSIYHYFPSKISIAMAVLEYVVRHFERDILSFAYREELPLKARRQALVEAIEEYLAASDGRCVIHHLTLESVNVPEFQPVIQHYFNSWIDALVHLLAPDHGEQEALILARDVVAQVMGAVLLGTAFHDAEPPLSTVELAGRIRPILVGA